MALIGRIRKQSGFLVIIIGVALAAFVLGDFIKKRPKTANFIAEVAGEKINPTDFNKKVECTHVLGVDLLSTSTTYLPLSIRK